MNYDIQIISSGNFNKYVTLLLNSRKYLRLEVQKNYYFNNIIIMLRHHYIRGHLRLTANHFNMTGESINFDSIV